MSRSHTVVKVGLIYARHVSNQVLMKTSHMDHLYTYHNASLYTDRLNFILLNLMKTEQNVRTKCKTE